jgi:Ca2+-binding RTX toxin-like protein
LGAEIPDGTTAVDLALTEYAFYFDENSSPERIMTRQSTDLGVSFGAPVVVSLLGTSAGFNGDLDLEGIVQGSVVPAFFRSNAFPHAAVNPVSGHIYVTYNDDVAGVDKGDVFMATSIDGGATFLPPVRVNDDLTLTDQWQPTITVSPGGDKVGVFYYSRQEDPIGNNLFKFYGRVGSVAGPVVTFTPSFAVSDVASLPEFGRDGVVNPSYMGDYDYAVATPGEFHVTWADNRDDLASGPPRKDPNVYYETIPLNLAVVSTVPAVGSVVTVAPTTFTVNVTDPVVDITIDATDFSVNGIPADSFAYATGSTSIDFMFASTPVTMEGLQTMHVDAGAFTSAADASLVSQFDGTIRFDLLPLEVISTAPAFPGGVFTLPGPFVFDVNFNEPVEPLSVEEADLMLSGIGGAIVIGVTVLPGNTTAQFTIDVPSEGTLTATIMAGAVTDGVGNPNLEFSADYDVDIGTVSYPIPLVAKGPLGSLVYDPSVSGAIFPGDTDSYTIDVDPGQTITVLVTADSASLQPSVSLRDPSSIVIGGDTATAAGENALIQTAAAAAAGTYTIDVTGSGLSLGDYTVQVILNAAQEEEDTVAGASNDTTGTAQNIDGSFITVQTPQASARRGAVLGVTGNAGYDATPVPFAFEDISSTGTVIGTLTGEDDEAETITPGFTFNFYGTNYSSYGVHSNGLITFDGTEPSNFTNDDLTNSPELAAIAPFWDDLEIVGAGSATVLFQVLGAGPGQHLVIQWNEIGFCCGGASDTLTFQAALFADGSIRFNYLDLTAGDFGDEGGSATVGLKDAGIQGPDRLLLVFNDGPNAFVGSGQSTLITPPNPTPDIYSFALAAGDIATLALAGLAAGPFTLDLLNPGGMVIASGVGGSTNLDSVISNVPIGVPGTYFARVSGGSNLPYDLVVTRNASFDTEPNDSFATAQNISATRRVLGSVGAGMGYEVNSLPFSFIDISATGTEITSLTGFDDNFDGVSLPFTFSFFGMDYTSLFVSTNGLITFGAGTDEYSNDTLDSNPAEAAIAVFWDDLFITNTFGTARVLTQTLGPIGSRQFVVQWDQVSFCCSGSSDTLTFQAILSEGSNDIRFNYLDLVSGSDSRNEGAEATAGIKIANPTNGAFVELINDSGPNAFVGSGLSTLIGLPSGEDWYSFNVSSAGTMLRLETATPSDGPVEFVNVLNPLIELYDPAGMLVATGMVTGDGRNETIDYLTLAMGNYRVRITGETDTSGEYFLTVAATLSPPVVVNGTPGNDVITVVPNSTNNTLITVFVNGMNTGSHPAAGITRLVINGFAGNDTIYVHGSIRTPIEAHGGEGHDRITGGAGDDVLIGDEDCETGRDTVIGGGGHDVLVGGALADNLDGGGGNDILLGGVLVAPFDDSFANLRAIGNAWALGGMVAADLADNNSDNDIYDIALDTFTGGTGRDWFIGDAADRIADSKRIVADGDLVTRIMPGTIPC